MPRTAAAKPASTTTADPVAPVETETPTAIEILAGEPSSAADVKAIVDKRAEKVQQVARKALTDKTPLIAAVRAHATKNRNRKGWATVVTMSDADIAAVIGRCRTESGAVNAVLNHVHPVPAKQAETAEVEAAAEAEGGEE